MLNFSVTRTPSENPEAASTTLKADSPEAASSSSVPQNANSKMQDALHQPSSLRPNTADSSADRSGVPADRQDDKSIKVTLFFHDEGSVVIVNKFTGINGRQTTSTAFPTGAAAGRSSAHFCGCRPLCGPQPAVPRGSGRYGLVQSDGRPSSAPRSVPAKLGSLNFNP